MSKKVAVLLLLAVSTGCRKEKTLAVANLNVQNKVAVRAVALFYESQEMLLVAERREVALPENPAAAVPAVMRELMKGSVNPSVPRLFPSDTVVRAAYLLPDGTAFVDLGGPTLSDGWATGTHQEMMAIHSAVQTAVTNFPEVKRVQILINGTPPETVGGHLSGARPFMPMPALVGK